jgi:hypothetical protein
MRAIALRNWQMLAEKAGDEWCDRCHAPSPAARDFFADCPLVLDIMRRGLKQPSPEGEGFWVD